MLVFEYKCSDCREHLLINDTYENVKKQEPFKCPQCKANMERQFTTSFILKGSGWTRDGYVTKGSLKDLDKQTEEEIMSLKSSAEERFRECLEILKKKNHDYGGDKDELFNFKLTELLNIASVENGILVRMTDKISRIATLLNKEAYVSDETIQDTLNDLINYAVILGYYLTRIEVGKTKNFK